MKTEEPLVSIVVITYNSSKYVLETLESCKAQTYQNIELIISDDGSKDDTIQICQEWLKKNQHNFVNSELITIERNTGIPANCNRGVKASKGEWIKIIAGDDSLKSHCIFDYIKFGFKTKNNLIQSNIDIYQNDFRSEFYLKTTKLQDLVFFNYDSKKQLKYLRKKNPIKAPAIFFKKELWEKNNFFDEEFRMIEDLPFWIKLTRNGYKFSLIENSLINYRINDYSIQHNEKTYFNSNFIDELLRVNKKYILNDLNFFSRLRINLRLKNMLIMDKMGLNNQSKISKILYYINSKI